MTTQKIKKLLHFFNQEENAKEAEIIQTWFYYNENSIKDLNDKELVIFQNACRWGV
jgi:hypothetical protein